MSAAALREQEASRSRLRPGDTVSLKGIPSPVMKVRRFGNYGDDCECTFFNRMTDGLGNVTWTPVHVWLSPAILARVEDPAS